MADYLPAKTIEAKVEGVYWAPRDTFVSEALDVLDLTYEGIAGDRHSGLYRKSGPREPWYPRGMAMRNERQLTLVAEDELAEIAAALSIPALRPEWIGANLAISGIPRLSFLPPRTRLFFAGGATLAVEGQNAPCRHAGAAIVEPLSPALRLALPCRPRTATG